MRDKKTTHCQPDTLDTQYPSQGFQAATDTTSDFEAVVYWRWLCCAVLPQLLNNKCWSCPRTQKQSLKFLFYSKTPLFENREKTFKRVLSAKSTMEIRHTNPLQVVLTALNMIWIIMMIEANPQRRWVILEVGPTLSVFLLALRGVKLYKNRSRQPVTFFLTCFCCNIRTDVAVVFEDFWCYIALYLQSLSI